MSDLDFGPKSNALFHFTSRMDYLQSILQTGFQPRYSLEYWPWFNDGYFVSHAMTCFCDIPLTRISVHTTAYGRFGLGMSRSWIRENKIQPLTYCPENSVGFKALQTVIEQLNISSSNAGKEAAWNLCRLYKLDRGPMFSSTGKLMEKDFTQESEWRFVPNSEKYFMGKNKHKHPKKLSKTITERLISENKKHTGKFNDEQLANTLNFGIDDIKYIFVSTNKQIGKMVKFISELDSLSGASVNVNQRSLLLTKLTSLDSIQRDY